MTGNNLSCKDDKKCSFKCPNWYFSLLKFPQGTGPICGKYNLPISAKEPGECYENIHKKDSKPIKSVSVWPGSLRGWGPITREVVFYDH